MRAENREAEPLVLKVQRLEALSAQLARADHHKNALILMVVHELRNPLSPLLCAAAALAHSKDPIALQVSALIERQVGQLSRIVDDLLTGTGEQTSPFTIEMCPVCMRDVIADALNNTQSALQDKRQRIQLCCESRNAHVEGDRQRLTQVLSNLVSNASKFSQSETVIEIVDRVQSGYEVIDVIDEGPGIAPQQRAEVFELFARGDPAATTGFGIGLWLARNFVELHGGTLTAHASPTGGTLMRLRLPICEGSSCA